MEVHKTEGPVPPEVPVPPKGTEEAEATGQQKITPMDKAKGPEIKELAKKIDRLAKQILSLRKELAEHVVLFGSGEIKHADEKLASIQENIQKLTDETHALELQLATAKSGIRRSTQENLIRSLKLEIATLAGQEEKARAALSQAAGNEVRRDINILLMEGTVDPALAAENYKKARALLQQNQGTQFPDLERKLETFANQQFKLTKQERILEKRLFNGEFAKPGALVSKEEAKIIESLITKKSELLKSEPDNNQKQILKNELKQLTSGLLNNPSFLSHFEAMQGPVESSFSDEQLNFLINEGGFSEMKLLLHEIGLAEMGIFASTKSRPSQVANLPEPVRTLKTEVTSKEKKEAFVKVGFLAFIFNREAHQLAKKLNMVALENLKLEKEIETKLQQLTGKSIANLRAEDAINQMNHLGLLIKQEKDVLENLKAELASKKMDKFTERLEKAILKQENMIERLEIKKEIIVGRFQGEGYHQALLFKNVMDGNLALVKLGPYSRNGEHLYQAFAMQQKIKKLAEGATEPLKSELEQLSKVTEARLQAPEFQDAAKLTRRQEKLRQSIMGGSEKELERLLTNEQNEHDIKEILDKERLSYIRETSPTNKLLILDGLSNLEARLKTSPHPPVFGSSDLTREYRELTRDEGGPVVDFYIARFTMLDLIAKGSKVDTGSAMLSLNKSLSEMSRIVNRLDPGLTSSILNSKYEEMSEVFRDYRQGITLKRSEKRASVALGKKEVSQSQQEKIHQLLIKKAAAAVGDNDEEHAQEVLELINKIKNSEVKLSTGDKIRAYFRKDSSDPLTGSKMWEEISQDTTVLGPLIDAMKEQSKGRISQTFDELENVFAESSENINKKRDKTVESLSKLTAQIKLYENLNFKGDRDFGPELNRRFQKLINGQMGRLMALPEDDLKANNVEMEFVGRIFAKVKAEVPSSFKDELLNAFKNDLEMRSKVEAILPRFEALFRKNPTELSKAIYDLSSIAELTAIDPEKLSTFRAYQKEFPLIKNFLELISSINSEIDLVRGEYNKLTGQIEELERELKEAEIEAESNPDSINKDVKVANLNEFLLKFNNYLEKLEALQAKFGQHSNEFPTGKTMLEVADIFDSREFKEYTEAVEEHLKTVSGMKAILQMTNREIGEAVKSGETPRSKLFTAAGLGSTFGMMSIPRQKVVIWDNLLVGFIKELEKNLPNQDRDGLENLQKEHKTNLDNLQHLEALEPEKFVAANSNLRKKHNKELDAFWKKELSTYEKQLDVEVADKIKQVTDNKGIAKEEAEKKINEINEDAKNKLSDIRSRFEARHRFAEIRFKIQTNTVKINQAYGRT